MSSVNGRGSAAPDSPSVLERVLALSSRDPRAAARLSAGALRDAHRLAPVERARVWRARAHALRAIGDYSAARLAYRHSRRLFATMHMDEERALGAIGLVDACMYLGRTAEALSAAEEAVGVFRRKRDVRRMAMLETNVGNLLHREDRLDEALAHYGRAARLLRTVGSPVERAMVDHNLANVYILVGRREEADAAFQRACQVFEQNDLRVLAAQTRYGIACLRFLSGEYAVAIHELEQVRPELQRVGARPLLALADLDLAEVLLSIRLLPEALSLARSASHWFSSRSVPAEHARALLAAGTALGLLRRDRAATRALDRASRLFRAGRLRTGLASVAMARAQLELRNGRAGAAAHRAREAYRIFHASGLGLRAMAAGALAAEALFAVGRIEAARNLSRHLRRRPVHPGDAYSRARLARIEASSAARAGDLRSALGLYKEALAHSRRTESSLFVDEWRVGFLEGEPALLDEALGVLLRRRPAPTADRVRRWLELAASGVPARSRLQPPSLDHDVRRRMAELREELEACYARLWHGRAAGARRAEPARVRAIERRALALEGRLRRLAASHAPAREPGRAGYRSSLPPGAVELRFFGAGGMLGAIRSDASGSRLHTDLAPLEAVARLIRFLHYQMEVLASPVPELRPHREQAAHRAEHHLRSLSHGLLMPLLGSPPWPRELRIVPHGPLFRVPWHALPVDEKRLVSLCDVTLEAAGRGGSPAAAAERRGALVLGCADNDAAFIECEVQDVATSLRRGGVDVIECTGKDARRSRVEEASRTAALIHIAGHAVYRPEHPEFSALRLHDGWLHARDLAEMPLAGATLVLSACETGPRSTVGGEHVLGLVRGLLRAGARAAVASLWKVDDRGTLELMRRLYQEWRTTGRLGAALNSFQRQAVTKREEIYRWAPFCLIGEPDVPWPGQVEQHLALQHATERTHAG